MSKQTIFIGTNANDGTGDTLRDGASKINQNFDELYILAGSEQSETIAASSASNPIVVNTVLTNTGQIDISLPNGTRVGQTKRFFQKGSGPTQITPSSFANGTRVTLTVFGVLDFSWDGTAWYVVNDSNTHITIS